MNYRLRFFRSRSDFKTILCWMKIPVNDIFFRASNPAKPKTTEKVSELIELKIQRLFFQSLGLLCCIEDFINNFSIATNDSSDTFFRLTFPSKSLNYETSKQCKYKFSKSKIKLKILFNYKLDFLHQVLERTLQTCQGKFDQKTIASDSCNKILISQKLGFFLSFFFLAIFKLTFMGNYRLHFFNQGLNCQL